jgi:hypothetical protein
VADPGGSAVLTDAGQVIEPSPRRNQNRKAAVFPSRSMVVTTATHRMAAADTTPAGTENRLPTAPRRARIGA